MIAFLRGKLVSVQAGVVVLEVGGVGYRLHVPFSLSGNLPPAGEEVLLYTHLVIREDGLRLFGFFAEEELTVFLKILSVTGVGSKGALALLSIYSPEEIRLAISQENTSVLTKAPGIGKKIAGRIILELKEKISDTKVKKPGADREDGDGEEGERKDAIIALETLGYTRGQAGEAVEQVLAGLTEAVTATDLVKKALRLLSKL